MPNNTQGQFGYNLHMSNQTLGNVNIGYGLAVTPVMTQLTRKTLRAQRILLKCTTTPNTIECIRIR